MNELYPAIEPYNTFKLKVSDIHEIFVEESGTPNGKPVVFLHPKDCNGTLIELEEV